MSVCLQPWPDSARKISEVHPDTLQCAMEQPPSIVPLHLNLPDWRANSDWPKPRPRITLNKKKRSLHEQFERAQHPLQPHLAHYLLPTATPSLQKPRPSSQRILHSAPDWHDRILQVKRWRDHDLIACAINFFTWQKLEPVGAARARSQGVGFRARR